MLLGGREPLERGIDELVDDEVAAPDLLDVDLSLDHGCLEQVGDALAEGLLEAALRIAELTIGRLEKRQRTSKDLGDGRAVEGRDPLCEGGLQLVAFRVEQEPALRLRCGKRAFRHKEAKRRPRAVALRDRLDNVDEQADEALLARPEADLSMGREPLQKLAD